MKSPFINYHTSLKSYNPKFISGFYQSFCLLRIVERFDATILHMDQRNLEIYGAWYLNIYKTIEAVWNTLIVHAHINITGYIHKKLKESKAWFAWGHHNEKYSERCKPLVQWPKMRLTSSRSIQNAIGSFVIWECFNRISCIVSPWVNFK